RGRAVHGLVSAANAAHDLPPEPGRPRRPVRVGRRLVPKTPLQVRHRASGVAPPARCANRYCDESRRASSVLGFFWATYQYFHALMSKLKLVPPVRSTSDCSTARFSNVRLIVSVLLPPKLNPPPPPPGPDPN